MSTFKLPRKYKLEGFRRKKVKKPRTKSNTIRFRKSNYSDLRIEKEYSYIHEDNEYEICLLYTSPSPRDQRGSRMPSSA